MVIVWNEFHGQAVRCSEGVNLQALFVGWTASKTNRSWSVGSLHTEFAHGQKTSDPIHGSSLGEKRSVDDGQGRGNCMSGRKKKSVRKVRVAHALPTRRRMAIVEALKEHQTEDRPEWDRTSDWGDIRFNRKRIKPGTLEPCTFLCSTSALVMRGPSRSPSFTVRGRVPHHGHWWHPRR